MPRKKKSSGRRSGFGNTRSERELYRKRGNKQRLKKIVIVCEGAETEPNYFQALRQEYRLSTLQITIVKGKRAPISVVNEARKQKDELDDKSDQVWCVFDTEIKVSNSSFHEAVSKARNKKLRLAISNPAFEYWYLLHFECTDRSFQNADQVIKELEKHIPNYSKSAPVFRQLKPKISEAIENAAQLRERACESWNEFPNPSTGVDKL